MDGQDFRFSDAIYAIGATPRALRNWLQRDQVKLISKRGADGSWRTFTYADIAILTLVRKLVGFGIGVETASLMAHEAIKNFPDFVKKMPQGLPLAFANRVLIAWPEENGERWQLRLVDKWKGEKNLARILGPVDAYLELDIESILRKAFDRANDSVGEGGE